MNAIIDIIACYYVFDISYPKGVQGILVFFETLCFCVKFSLPLPLVRGSLLLVERGCYLIAFHRASKN